jgi:hypothetical protein
MFSSSSSATRAFSWAISAWAVVFISWIALQIEAVEFISKVCICTLLVCSLVDVYVDGVRLYVVGIISQPLWLPSQT